MSDSWVSLRDVATLTGLTEEYLRAAIVIGNLAGKPTDDGKDFVIPRDNALHLASLVRAMRFTREQAKPPAGGDLICRIALLLGILVGSHVAVELLVRAYFWLS